MLHRRTVLPILRTLAPLLLAPTLSLADGGPSHPQAVAIEVTPRPKDAYGDAAGS